MLNSVAFYTLGCKLNFSETSTISRQLETAGLLKKEFTDSADIYVINTCSVTDHADRKCKKVVKEALKYNPNAFIVVIGCYAQLKPEEIANIPGVDLVLGAAEKFNLVQHLSGIQKKNDKARVHNQNIKETNVFIPGFSIGDRTRSFLKVQDGCSFFICNDAQQLCMVIGLINSRKNLTCVGELGNCSSGNKTTAIDGIKSNF